MESTNLYITFIFCVGFFIITGCDNTDEMPEQESKFQLNWKTPANDGEYFFGNKDIHLYKDLIITSGNLKTIPGDIQNVTPAIVAFNRDSGEKIWTYEPENSLFFGNIDFSFVVNSNFIGLYDNGILVIDLETQTEKWSFSESIDIYARSVPTIHNNRIYRSYEKYKGGLLNVVVSHDIDNGDEIIHFSQEGSLYTSPVFWTDPNSGESLKIVVAKTPSGSKAQAYSLSGDLVFEIIDVPIIGIGNFAVRYPIIYENILYIQGDVACGAYDLIGRKHLWSYSPDIEATNGQTIPIIFDDKLILNLGERDITGLDKNSGSLLWNNEGQCRDCSLHFLINETRGLILFTDEHEGQLKVINSSDGSIYHCHQEFKEYNYDIVYDETTNTFYSRTHKEIFSFNLN